jgi:hypothetical protein
VKTPAALPYLLPPDDAVNADPWRTCDGIELGERLDHWDPHTDIELIRAITVDIDAVRDSCGLGVDSALALTASWGSNRTRLTATGDAVEFGSMAGSLRAPVSVFVPGASAGGRLELRARLVLRSPGEAPSPISPHRPGAILWTDTTHVAMEGNSARFPMTVTDFSLTPRLPDRGAWSLEWHHEDLEAPVLGGLRLLINEANEQLLDALRSGSSDPRSNVIRSFVTFDVARSLVHGALQHESFASDPEAFDDGSVGRMLFELLAACWPGLPLPALRVRHIEDPARLDAELQAYLGVLG